MTVIELLPEKPAGAAPLVQVSTALDGVSAADGTDVFIASDTVLRRLTCSEIDRDDAAGEPS